MSARFTASRLLVALSPLFLLSGCMSLARSDGEPAAQPSDVEVGQGLGGKGGRTTTTTQPDDSGGQAATTTAPPSGEEGYANETIKTDPSGFKLILSASGRLRYGVKENPNFQLEIENVSNKTLHFDSNQVRFFAIKPSDGRNSPVWGDHMCNEQGSAYEGPALTLEPGEKLTLATATYPAEEIAAEREPCRVLTAGKYQLAGVVNWCPPGSLDDGKCPSDKVKPIISSPLTITFE